MIWTDAAVTSLRELLADPSRPSAAVIAACMRDEGYDITRNSIIGKAKRLGLTLPFVHPPRKPTAIKPAAVSPAGPPLNLSLNDLEPHHCRWPYGDGPFVFCGHPKDEGSYCAYHARQARGGWTCEAAA